MMGRTVGGRLYNSGRVIVASLGRNGHRRTETSGDHDSVLNERRFADLVDLCHEHGLTIEWADLGPVRHGQYKRDRQLIELNSNLNLRQLVPGLAHEYAHFVYDDGCSTTSAEKRAWEYAAQMLISPAQYAEAERVCGPRVNAIAIELDLTGVVVEAWRRWWRESGMWLSAEARPMQHQEVV